METLHQAWEKPLEEALKRKGETEDLWRPLLHIAPPVGWLNDPNGLCQYRGVYHTFYQMAPFDPKGGLKFWGHCTSTDLLHWEFQGVPLMPDRPFDRDGAYSGSALVEDGRIYVFYTGNVKLSGEYDFVNTGREANTVLAVSADGLRFASKELLMGNEDYPQGLTKHVRDPKVWKKDTVYYMVQGARTKENKGVVLLFSSEDLRNWKYVRRLEYEEMFGYMWECPDVYELDGRLVLSVSPQGVAADGFRYANKYQSGTCFLEGEFPGGLALGEFKELDGGFDFYAPQTFLTDDGRRIQIGWVGMPDVEKEYQNKTLADGWQNMLTIPRELSVREGILCQNPVRELDGWWNRKECFDGAYEGATGICYELSLQAGGGDMEVILSDGLHLRYEAGKKLFCMEFTDASLGAGRSFRGRELERLTDLRILVDVSCVEVFLNGGEDVFTTRFYPEKGQYRVRVQGDQIRGCRRWHSEEDDNIV